MDHPTPPRNAPPDVDESAWMDVIQKMDEVYQQLVRDEIALEEKNQQLEQSQQFILSLLSSMSDVLVACDSHGRIEETNAALRELVGLSEQQLRGRSAMDLLDDAHSVERLQAVLRHPRPERAGAVVDINLRDAQGRTVPVDLNCTPRRDGAGRVLGYVFVGRPMGEIKRAYQELQQTHEALKQAQQQLLHSEKLASLGRLVAGVAHELNNPISFVLGNVHALKKYTERLAAYLGELHAGADAVTLAEQRRRLRIDHLLADLPSLIEGTLEGGQRTADIVQGLKRFSAMDREQRERVDLNTVIERAIHWIRKGTAPQFTMHWDAQAPCWVWASAGQLLQVMLNLLQNAHDAAVGHACAPAAWVTLHTVGHRAVIEVRDNGPGIAPEHLGHIFDPFFTTKPVGQGTGLGLSISFGVIEQHGGQLLARSAPEGGALFEITLPRVP